MLKEKVNAWTDAQADGCKTDNHDISSLAFGQWSLLELSLNVMNSLHSSLPRSYSLLQSINLECANFIKGQLTTGKSFNCEQIKQEDHDGPISLTGVPSSKGVQWP